MALNWLDKPMIIINGGLAPDVWISLKQIQAVTFKLGLVFPFNLDSINFSAKQLPVNPDGNVPQGLSSACP